MVDLSFSFCDCLPYYLRFLTLFVVFLGDWLGYEIAGFVFGDKLFSMYLYGARSTEHKKMFCCVVTLCNLIRPTLCRSQHTLSLGYKR